MVLLHIKINDKNQYLLETTTQYDCTDIIKDVVLGISIPYIVNNLRVKVDLLAMQIENLMKHGPLKPEDSRGLKETENMEADVEYVLNSKIGINTKFQR